MKYLNDLYQQGHEEVPVTDKGLIRPLCPEVLDVIQYTR